MLIELQNISFRVFLCSRKEYKFYRILVFLEEQVRADVENASLRFSVLSLLSDCYATALRLTNRNRTFSKWTANGKKLRLHRTGRLKRLCILLRADAGGSGFGNSDLEKSLILLSGMEF